MNSLSRLLCAAAALACTSSLWAGTPAAKDFKAMTPECPPDNLTTIDVSGDYVGESNFKHSSGKQSAAHFDFEADRLIPLDYAWPNATCGKWYLKLGVNYDRFDFDTSRQTRVPNTLQSISGVIALNYLVKGNTAILLETRPGVYFEHDINSGAFDSPTTLAIAYPVFGGDKFYLIGGATGSLLRSPGVLPVVGVLWHISDKWDLRAYVPQPRLVYQATDKLEIYVGGELAGGGYKTDHRQVDPQKLSGGVVTYSDIRAGGGVIYTCKPFTVDLAVGASLRREFDYDRAGSRFRTEPAPYVKLAVSTAF